MFLFIFPNSWIRYGIIYLMQPISNRTWGYRAGEWSVSNKICPRIIFESWNETIIFDSVAEKGQKLPLNHPAFITRAKKRIMSIFHAECRIWPQNKEIETGSKQTKWKLFAPTTIFPNENTYFRNNWSRNWSVVLITTTVWLRHNWSLTGLKTRTLLTMTTASEFAHLYARLLILLLAGKQSFSSPIGWPSGTPPSRWR